MKTTFLSLAFFLLTASGVAFGQSTTISTNPKTKAGGDTSDVSNSTPGTGRSATTGDRKTASGTGHQKSDGASQPGRATGAGDRSTPGGDDGNGGTTGKTKLPGNQSQGTNKKAIQEGKTSIAKDRKPKSEAKKD
ncbi:hypothetical protein [Dyadobacter sp.]|uniref:hypothetical protein n=1 Tax=Dyadobacter sp. TaxID=1914288 RepID=UPI003F711810